MRKLLPLAALALVGCSQSTGDDYLRHILTGQPTQSQLNQIEIRKKEWCASIGAPEGSPEYFECRKFIVEQEIKQQQMMMVRQASWNDVGNTALMSVGTGQYVAPGMQPSPMIKCTTKRPNQFDTSIQTICE